MHKIANSQPSKSAAGVPWTQKQRHHRGNNPEKDQDVARPQCAERRVQVVVIVGIESLANRGQEGRKTDEAPYPPAEGAGLARSQPSHRGAGQRGCCVNPVAPPRCCFCAVSQRQHRPMNKQQGCRRCHGGRAIFRYLSQTSPALSPSSQPVLIGDDNASQSITSQLGSRIKYFRGPRPAHSPLVVREASCDDLDPQQFGQS